MILSSPKHIYNHIDRCRRDIIANNVPHTRTYLSYWEGKTFIWFWQTLSKRYRMTCSCHLKIMVAIYITMCLFPFFYLEIYCKEKYLAQWYEEIVSFQTWPSFMLYQFLHLRCKKWIYRKPSAIIFIFSLHISFIIFIFIMHLSLYVL